jgi:phosphomannomutase/phosphoglucomutase
MSVYKPCDIRGPVTELSPERYGSWGRSIGRRIQGGETVIVGGDVRVSTPVFQAGLVEGLRDAGAAVLDVGIVPTPMVYFAGRDQKASACAVVTSSHSPPDTNGLKWTIGSSPPSEEQVAEFEVEERNGVASTATSRGVVETVSPEEAYLAWLETVVAGWEPANEQPPLRILIDPGSGCWAGRAGPMLERCFPGLAVGAIYNDPDGTFSSRNPDSSRPEHLETLCRDVVEGGFALGLAFDGDGDRVAFVDETGHVLSSEEATHILLQAQSDTLRGHGFVYDLKFSDVIPASAAALGARPLVERSGHAFIRSRMRAEGAAFGAEVSGHFFYKALDSGDDALYSGALLLARLGPSGRSLGAWRRDCPPVYMTPELRRTLSAKEMDRLLESVETRYRDRPISRVDGLRIEFNDGWALMRKSVTEPALTFRFEGRSAAALDRIVEEFRVAGIVATD